MNPTTLNDTIIQEITIQAPAEQIFDALTNPERLVQWWTVPGRFQMTHLESDLRPGGKRIMRGSGYGRPVTITGAYREIERPRLLVFTWLPDWQGDAVESVVRFELEEKDGVTTVRLTHSGLVSENSRESHRGWPQILALLQVHAESQAHAERLRSSY
jgi:uncharacterized protein YndB with AHSA1/START domain